MLELEFERTGDPRQSHIWRAVGEEHEFKCKQCRKKITEGFMCENDGTLILCQKCQDNFPMRQCKFDKRGEHQHIKWVKGEEEKD